MDPPKGLDDLLATGRPPTANVTDIPCPRTRYLVPGPLEPHPTNDPEGFYSGHATRFKLEDFSRSTMETFDLTQVNPPASEGLRGFCGGFTDGTYELSSFSTVAAVVVSVIVSLSLSLS